MILLKVIISGLLLYFLIRDVNIGDILVYLKSADKILLVSAFLLHGIGFYISALRWQVLLKAQDVDSKIMYLVKSYIVGIFFNHFMPSTIGGDSVRAYDSWRLGDNKAKALAVIVIDRLMGLLALLTFVLVATFFAQEITSNIPSLYLWLALLSSIIFGLLWFIFLPPLKLVKKIVDSRIPILSKIATLFLKIAYAFVQFRTKKPALIKSFILSVILQANVVFYYYLISLALGFNISIDNFFLIVPLTIFIMMIPISLNGIGLRENAFAFFFAFYGIAKSQAISFAWTEFSMLLVLGIIGGFVYMFRK